MPPKRKARGGAASGPKRRSARQRKELNDEIPDVYMDMLAEVTEKEAANAGPPGKRRKLSEEPRQESSRDLGTNEPSSPTAGAVPGVDREGSRLQQMVLDDFSASSDDEDADFEDVEIGASRNVVVEDDVGLAPEQKSLEIDLSKHPLTPRRAAQRRKIASPAERALRLSVHKTHLLLLLLSISTRNRWCESSEVQGILKPLVRKKTIKQLHLDESQPQWKRSTAFNDAIQEIAEMWRTTYNINVRGMRRAHWRSDIDMEREMDKAEDMLDFDDFKTCSYTRSGSRDLGAQLFCALLRACAVDTRLVCSLQVLPFSASATQQAIPDLPGLSTANYIRAPAQEYGSSSHSTSRPRDTDLNESPYPIFWVEVYSPAISTWIPVDPLVRNTFNKPKTGFEPPASDSLNAMSYVIAFEGDDGSARDVTRRYAQWFNAKTRKTRVELTKGGTVWYASVMKFFAKPFKEDRDAIEDIELARRNELEGMPKSIQDFKGHPLYVLERHLRRNEVIHPRLEAGRVLAGSGGVSATAANKKLLEPVFRRKDVHICRSADAWYRRGRDVKPGESPLKHAVSGKRQQPRERDAQHSDSEEGEDKDATALYAEFQTQLYKPPPIVDEHVPRNAFGNLDVYVPSMIPAGAIHVRHPMAAKAAQILGVDYADAVTGFEFKGRQGTAVIDGVVVSAKQRVVMVTVIVGLQSQVSEEAERQRSRVLLAIWKKWLAALRIKEQIAHDYGGRALQQEHNQGADDEEDGDPEDATYHDEDDDTGGGFFIEAPDDESNSGGLSQARKHADVPPLALPNGKLLPDDLPPPPSYQEIVVVESPNKPPMAEEELAPIGAAREQGGFLFGDEENDTLSGGFIPEPGDEGGGGGGFLVEEDEEGEAAATMGIPGKEKESNRPVTALGIPSSGGGGSGGGGGGGGGFLSETSYIDSAEPQVEDSKNGDDHNEQLQPPSGVLPHSSLEVTNAPPPLAEHAAPPQLRPESTQSSALIEDGDDEDRLSHDPDEDEAEPEWLNESLGID